MKIPLKIDLEESVDGARARQDFACRDWEIGRWISLEKKQDISSLVSVNRRAEWGISRFNEIQ